MASGAALMGVFPLKLGPHLDRCAAAGAKCPRNILHTGRIPGSGARMSC